MDSRKIMTTDELEVAENEWKKGKDISPLADIIVGEEAIAEAVRAGKITPTVIGILPPATAKIGYTDAQNRIVSIISETAGNAQSRYAKKILQVTFKLNIEQSQKALEKYGDKTAVNSRARELFLADLETDTE